MQLLPLLGKQQHVESRQPEEGKSSALQESLNICLICCLEVKLFKRFPSECHPPLCIWPLLDHRVSYALTPFYA